MTMDNPTGAHTEYHNPVLTRSHEPARANHAWVAIIPAIIAVVAGAAIWAYVSTQKSPTIINHAVAAAPATPAGWRQGGG